MHQTLSLTTLGELEASSPVNLELPLRPTDRLGGHVVQGHVDGTGTVADLAADGFAKRLRIELPEELLPYVVERGSIAIEGVSLTSPSCRRCRARGLADPRDARADHARGRRARRPRERRMRRARPVRPPAAATPGVSPLPRKEQPMAEADRDREEDRSPFATIEEAIEDIRRGRMVVVCDDENRENEGDLTMAAQFATPEAINFMAKHGRGLICLALTDERCDELGLNLMAAKNEAPVPDRLHGLGRGPRGRHHRDLGRRPRPDDPGRDRSALPARGPGPARPRLPAEGEGRRRARAHRPDRGGGRPRPPRRPDPRRGDLRGDERGRHDGPGPGPGRVLRQARPEDDHRRRPDRLPAADREAGRADRLHQAADEVRRVQRSRLPLADRRQAPRRDGQGRGRGVRRTCWSASTRSA